MMDILPRYLALSNNIRKINQPSLELQLESIKLERLSEEVTEKSHQLRLLRGEDLHGLKIEELRQLEKKLEVGLSRVLTTKDDRIMNEISTLERKEAMLLKENNLLKEKMASSSKEKRHVLAHSDTGIVEQGRSSESVNNVCSSRGGRFPEDEFSVTSLKLGSVYWVPMVTDISGSLHCGMIIVVMQPLPEQDLEPLPHGSLESYD